MAGPHQPFGLPDPDLPHQKYMYVCVRVCVCGHVMMFSFQVLVVTPQPVKLSCFRFTTKMDIILSN